MSKSPFKFYLDEEAEAFLRRFEAGQRSRVVCKALELLEKEVVAREAEVTAPRLNIEQV